MPQIGWWLLPLVALLWLNPFRPGRISLRRTPFDWFLLVFVATAVIGLWVSYDPAQAMIKLGNIFGAVAIFYALVGQRRRDMWRMAGLMGALGSVIAGYFLLTHDWQVWPADIGILTRIGVAWMALRPSLLLPAIHPNLAGGLIAILLPFQVAFGLYVCRKQRQTLCWMTVILGVLTLAGFLLTSSRAAWLSLAAAGGFSMLWAISDKASKWANLPRRRAFILLTGMTAGLGLSLSFPVSDGLLSLLNRLPGADSATSRLDLFQHTLDLIGDFPFTGGGLAAFPGLYSQYIAVTPFFQFNYSHNLWLDVTLEQGALGLFALAWIIVGSGVLLWRTISRPAREVNIFPESRQNHQFRRDLNLFRWATAVGLLAMVLHSLVDDALYGGLGTPLLFFLPGMAVSISRKREVRRLFRGFFTWKSRLCWIAAGVAVGLVGPHMMSGRSLAADWYANWGAVSMARLELRGWPTGRWDDGRNAADLAPAINMFQRAITIEAENRVAQHRLGLAAMLQRDFATAVSHLEAAYALDHEHRGIIKSLGYSYVWLGDLEKAAVLLADIPEAHREMEAYSNWWNEQGRSDLAAKADKMALIFP